jgi:hypothetical protein
MPAHLFLAPGPNPVNMSPATGALPGSNVIQSLANGLDSWALITGHGGRSYWGGRLGMHPANSYEETNLGSMLVRSVGAGTAGRGLPRWSGG